MSKCGLHVSQSTLIEEMAAANVVLKSKTMAWSCRNKNLVVPIMVHERLWVSLSSNPTNAGEMLWIITKANRFVATWFCRRGIESHDRILRRGAQKSLFGGADPPSGCANQRATISATAAREAGFEA